MNEIKLWDQCVFGTFVTFGRRSAKENYILVDRDLTETQQVGKQCHDNFFGPRYKLQSIYIIQHRTQK